MSSSLTARLKLYKADPGTGEQVDVAKLNQSLDKLDAAIAPADIANTAARPATPFSNQMVREDDTNRLFLWNNADSRWDQVVVGGVTTSGNFISEGGSATDSILIGRVVGDASHHRILVGADGKIEWGSGAFSRDTTLYRAGANLLQTDDTFNAAAGLQAYGLNITGSENGISNAVATGSVTGAFVNIPTTSSFTLAKKRSDTRIRIDISLSCYGSANTLTTLGVRVNSVDYTCTRERHTEVEYESISGFVYVPAGVPAGNQTIQGRWASSATSNTESAVSWLCLSAREVD